MKIKISSGNGGFKISVQLLPPGRHTTAPHHSSLSPYFSPQAITTKLPLPYQMYKWASGTTKLAHWQVTWVHTKSLYYQDTVYKKMHGSFTSIK